MQPITPAIEQAAKILKTQRAIYRTRPFAEILLAVAATAAICPHAVTASQLARDTLRSEYGSERKLSHERKATRLSAEKNIDVENDEDHVAEIAEREDVAAMAQKIRASLGSEISDGLAEGLSLRDIAEILGRSHSSLHRQIVEVRKALASELA